MATVPKAPPITIEQFEQFEGYPGLRDELIHGRIVIRFPAANSMPAPDDFVVTREAWMLACREEQYLTVPPVLVVEVISPANRRRRVGEKVDLYLDGGVKQVWTVAPKSKSVRVHDRFHGAGFEAGRALKLPGPLSGSVPVAEIFRLDV